MPRPRSLTDPQLASAALAVLDRSGLAGLTMRAVAEELGMGTMSLYRYVHDRAELEGLVLDQVLAAVDTEPPAATPATSWQDRVQVLVERIRHAVGAHPAVVPLTVTQRHRSVGLLRWGESVLAVLGEAGFEGERRVIALRGLLSYVIGAIQLEHLGPLSGTGTAVISGLPAAEFPYMAETARHAQKVDADREFLGGLAMLLRGMDA